MSNLQVVSKKSKSGKQEVQGVIVSKIGGEFLFNYNTTKDPQEHHLELLKNFRNSFVDELNKLNEKLAKFTDK